jgi:hypothetical protein
LSLFLEARGFTFRTLGEHRVYATWLLPNGTVLRSNEIALNVRGRYGSTSFADHVQSVLTRREPVRLLYHRNGRFHRAHVEALAEIARRTRDPMLEANINYALGRYFASKARRPGTRKKAIAILERALDRSELSPQRRRNASVCVARFEE